MGAYYYRKNMPGDQPTRHCLCPPGSANKASRGFTLLELVLVVAIILIMAAVTVLSLQPAIKNARANTAFDDVMMQLRVARQRAVAERKQYIVCFGAGSAPQGAVTQLGAPNAQSVQMFRWDAQTSLSAAVQVNAIQLPFDMQFQTLTGFPTNPAFVPDGFGSGTVAIDFDQGVAGAIQNQVMFLPDGSAHDTNGSLNSGIIYVARTGDLNNSRAITVYGATGRIRGWRLDGVPGSLKWTEQ
jgi:prepilin-type N-terminal cleavage/methylation domain-containing protein